MIAIKPRAAGPAVMILLAALSTASAEEPRLWSVEITPMAWIAGIEGTVTVDGEKTDFDKSASDLFDYVEFAGGLIATVQYERWVLRGQFDAFDLSTDALDVEDRPLGGKLDSNMLIVGLGAGYQIDGWKEGQTFDLLAGLRSLNADNDLEVYGEDGGSYSKQSELLDPVLAVRGNLPIFPSKIKGLWLNAMASLGGGGDSELVYELQPQLQYRIMPRVAARLGYRRAGWKVDADGSDNELDFSLAGLNFGVGVTF